MATRNKPYDQFGPYILFKKLEGDSLGDLWRAGRIDGAQLGPVVALRRLSGGNREALAASSVAVSQLLPKLTGTSFVRDQAAGVEAGVPFVAWDYAGGRSLRHIINAGRGTKDAAPNPLPIDQAMVIAEKIALSLATISELRDTSGGRLSHGALLPHFIWISDDGEIRVGGQQLGAGITASLADPKVAAEIGRYFSPESRTSGKASDVYSMGAILFLLVTGQEPPDAATASAFGAAVRAAKTLTGAAIPDDIRVILDKSFNLDPSMRYASMTDMKQAVSALAHGNKYSATTFNLAFYLSHLLKREMESEAVDRDKEAKVNVAAYLEAPKPAPVAAPVAPVASPFAAVASASAASASAASASADEPQRKSKLPLAIAAVLVVCLLGGAGFMMMRKTPAQAAPTNVATAAAVAPVIPQQRIVSEPIVAVATPQTGTAPVPAASTDPAAQQKAFEEAVRQRMNAEMMKLQNQYMEELRRKQANTAPAPAPAVAAPAPAEERPALSAAQLDQQRREARQEQLATTTQAPAPAPAPVQTQQPAAQPAAPQTASAAPAVTPTRSAVSEGDVIDVSTLDNIPRPSRPISLQYPALARQQKVTATVILSALVDEQGRVTDVKVLRGEQRFGINEAAIRAIRATRFSSPMKDGKRVKTWLPQTFEFKP